MADGDLNKEELLGNLSEYDSATKAADILPHSVSVNKQAAPAFISPKQISSLTSAIQSLTERLVESPKATKGKSTKGKATTIKRKGKMGESSIPAKKLCPDIGSMSKDSSDSECETLLNQVMNSQPPTSAGSRGQQEKHSPNSDDDADLRELTKEYESEDSVGAALKSEQLAKLLNNMFWMFNP